MYVHCGVSPYTWWCYVEHFLNVPSVVGLILQLLCSPIGSRNFHKKIKQNIANEGTPHIVDCARVFVLTLAGWLVRRRGADVPLWDGDVTCCRWDLVRLFRPGTYLFQSNSSFFRLQNKLAQHSTHLHLLFWNCFLQCLRWKAGYASASGLPRGTSQTKEFCPLLDVFFPSIYRIFRASHNANRWCIINQMFANSLPVDARVKNIR